MINFNNLDSEEQELLDSFERDEWISELTPERLTELQSYAEATLAEKQKDINLQRLLIILRDGKWHSSDELTSKVSHRFGKIIFEARKKGYPVETRSVANNNFEYRMQVEV